MMYYYNCTAVLFSKLFLSLQRAISRLIYRSYDLVYRLNERSKETIVNFTGMEGLGRTRGDAG